MNWLFSQKILNEKCELEVAKQLNRKYVVLLKTMLDENV